VITESKTFATIETFSETFQTQPLNGRPSKTKDTSSNTTVCGKEMNGALRPNCGPPTRSLRSSEDSTSSNLGKTPEAEACNGVIGMITKLILRISTIGFRKKKKTLANSGSSKD
jgi:hypothetical protein